MSHYICGQPRLSKARALVQCGSGNRVGALYSIGAHHLDMSSLERALKIREKAAITLLDPMIRDILGQ